jgi:type II secretory pathway pseudopilin PulG
MSQSTRNRRLPGRPQQEQGFTIVELLFAVTAFLLVAASAMQSAVSASRMQAQQSQRIHLQEVGRLAMEHLCREATEAACFYPAGFALTNPEQTIGQTAWAMVRPEFDGAGIPVPGQYRIVLAYLRPKPADDRDAPGAQQLVICRQRQLAWTPTVANGQVTNLPTQIAGNAQVIADPVAPGGWRVSQAGSPATTATFSLTMAFKETRLTLESGAYRRNRMPQ